METPRIRILPPETAKRIAAGEVIDRPAAALRELLDNALDAGASLIQVELEGGGAEGLRVADDGMGMGKEDLARSVLPHATSKIRDADDLLTLSTLGFRGEALASMAAVSSLSILSAGEDDDAWRIRCEAGKEPVLEPSRCSRGTVVQLRDLFSNFPARRQFLKRASAEANACRQVFVEKALPFPEVGFRLYSGGKPLLVLQPAGLARRVIEATGAEEPESFFRELVASGPGFGARIVTCSPASYRTDKKRLHIYVNKRRVQEYSLAQAVEYAFRDSLPGGTYPGAYVFLEVDPSLADFNIHPAKKEVRLRNLEDIRRGLIASIRAYLGSAAKAERANSLLADAPRQIPLDLDYGRPRDYSRNVDSQAERSSWSVIADLARERRESHGGQDEDAPGRPTMYAAVRDGSAGSYASERQTEAVPYPAEARYLGQALGVFLVAESRGGLLLLDQHAAHERILFEEMMAGKAASQELLVPVVYDPESDEEDRYIGDAVPSLASIGFKLAKEGSSWILEAAPAMLAEARTSALFETLRERPDPGALLRETAARAACRAAVKDGDALDDAAARALIARALALPDPHCPHGRPIWLRLSKDELYRAVRRIV